MSLDQYSQTPASNDLVNYGQTGMAPSKVKNAFWDVMADMCSVVGTGSMPTTGGTANAQTIVNTRQYAALYAGMWAAFIPSATNIGALTLQVDGLAAKNVFANGVAAIAGMVAINVPAICRYDGTQWNLINPQRCMGSFTITLTGMTATITGTVNYAIGADGKTVYWWVAAGILGTSNAATMTGTGIPAALSPTTSKRTYVPLEDSAGAGNPGYLLTGTSTTWTFGLNLTGSGFTNSSQKGLPITQASYTLD